MLWVVSSDLCCNGRRSPRSLLFYPCSHCIRSMLSAIVCVRDTSRERVNAALLDTGTLNASFTVHIRLHVAVRHQLLTPQRPTSPHNRGEYVAPFIIHTHPSPLDTLTHLFLLYRSVMPLVLDRAGRVEQSLCKQAKMRHATMRHRMLRRCSHSALCQEAKSPNVHRPEYGGIPLLSQGASLEYSLGSS